MSEFLTDVTTHLDWSKLASFGRALLLLLVGWLLARIVGRALARALGSRLREHHAFLLRRAGFFLVFGLFLAAALNEVGFKMTFLFGAAGIMTVALGFAARSSAANIISGLFLVGEEPFEIGDSIEVGATSGEVRAIDLLSVKLKTFDGRFVRIPNENLLKAEVINLSRFPLRRLDLGIGLDYAADLQRAQEVLHELAAANDMSLSEPPPEFVIEELAESAVNVRFSVWCRRQNLLSLRTNLYAAIPGALAAEGIDIPYPRRDLRIDGWTGSADTA